MRVEGGKGEPDEEKRGMGINKNHEKIRLKGKHNYMLNEVANSIQSYTFLDFSRFSNRLLFHRQFTNIKYLSVFNK